MVSIPTREQMENEIKELKAEVYALKQTVNGIDKDSQTFRILAENTPVGIYIIQDMQFKYVNPPLGAIFEECAENILKNGPLKYTHPDDHSAFQKNILDQLKHDPVTKSFAFRGIKVNGEAIYCEA